MTAEVTYRDSPLQQRGNIHDSSYLHIVNSVEIMLAVFALFVSDHMIQNYFVNLVVHLILSPSVLGFDCSSQYDDHVAEDERIKQK